MQYKHLSLLALASYALAQEGNGTQSLNETLAATPQLSNLTSFLGLNPDLVAALSSAQNITILAPNDDAFAAFAQTEAGQAVASDPGLLAAVLTYHVLNGTVPASAVTNTSAFVPTLLTNETYANVTDGQVVEAVLIGEDVVFYSGLLQNSTVAQADVSFSGGIIHIIDTVLTLPAPVVDTALAANLTSLAGALNFTNLVDAVSTTPDLTIFAPTNEAFQAIGSALENISESDLASILQYHVVAGTVGYSTDLQSGSSLQTLNGANLTVTIDDEGNVFVNSAQVIIPNVLIANGVVHVIDNVLNPDNTATPSPSATEGAPGFTASPGTEVPFTSGLPTPTTQIGEGPGPASSTAAGTGGGASTAAAMPKMTGAVGYGALLGAGAAVLMV